MALKEIDFLLRSAPEAKRVPGHAFKWTFDEEADVIYISFGEPREADDSEHTKDGLIRRYAKGELVGITILHASKRDASGHLRKRA